MRVLIYESSSRGGNFKYALSLFNAYRTEPRFSNVELLLPSNSSFPLAKGIKAKLISDNISQNKALNKVKFILRTFINPFILFFYLLRKEKQVVVFNDFEQ